VLLGWWKVVVGLVFCFDVEVDELVWMENIGGMEKGSPLLIDQADDKSGGQLWQFLPGFQVVAWFVRCVLCAFLHGSDGLGRIHSRPTPAVRAGRFDARVRLFVTPTRTW
jgi:hypothetical protein